MKKRMMAGLLILCLLVGAFAACGSESASSAPAESVTETEAPAPSVEPTPAPEPEASVPEPAPAETEEAEPEEASVQEPEEAIQETPEGPGPEICTVTFSDGQTFEATVGQEFVFFFQCDAPGDMGEPLPGEEGAGITVSDGMVTYSNVGLGGPFSYPTSELVTVSGFSGDFTVTITDAATNMGATYTIYTDEAEIADAIAFAENMAAQQAANPMPDQQPPAN